MRLLLDTHVFLWYITADPRLPAPFLAAIREPANTRLGIRLQRVLSNPPPHRGDSASIATPLCAREHHRAALTWGDGRLRFKKPSRPVKGMVE